MGAKEIPDGSPKETGLKPASHRSGAGPAPKARRSLRARARKLIGILVDASRTRLAHLMRVDENHKPAVYLQLAHAAELTELNYWLQLLRVSTREFFGQADRDRFEREASTALGIPVELELTQNLASMGEGDAITRLLASRAPAPAAQPILARYPSLAVRLTGYALRKELGRNKKLAEERAMAIQSQFTDRWKIDRRRIIVSTGGDFRRVVTLALIREPSGP